MKEGIKKREKEKKRNKKIIIIIRKTNGTLHAYSLPLLYHELMPCNIIGFYLSCFCSVCIVIFSYLLGSGLSSTLICARSLVAPARHRARTL
jgi:hypothetical protein